MTQHLVINYDLCKELGINERDLLVLNYYATTQKQYAWKAYPYSPIRVDTIANDLNISKRQVIRARNKLKELRYISSERMETKVLIDIKDKIYEKHRSNKITRINKDILEVLKRLNIRHEEYVLLKLLYDQIYYSDPDRIELLTEGNKKYKVANISQQTLAKKMNKTQPAIHNLCVRLHKKGIIYIFDGIYRQSGKAHQTKSVTFLINFNELDKYVYDKWEGLTQTLQFTSENILWEEIPTQEENYEYQNQQLYN